MNLQQFTDFDIALGKGKSFPQRFKNKEMLAAGVVDPR